ncbi:Coenzyme F420 hydrogenase/dehydrogenase, beta subunit C-terminal domain [Oligoflexia bacterium]|nr:Coenzyme F420 hydrogenase/dehydrogenase, beta subunit C-terminal domain [Oligoflexia bacterium]
MPTGSTPKASQSSVLVTKNSTQSTNLATDMPLRGNDKFMGKMEWPQVDVAHAPRALRGLASIIEEGLCHRCGTCVGICPTEVLGTDQAEYPTVKNLSACTDCDLCVKVCPGDSFDVRRAHNEVFSTEADLDSTHGSFSKAVIAHSTCDEVRKNSTSGGLVTAILLHLLEVGKIDGAVVIGSDEDVLWKGKPIVARTRAELLAAMKSKYAISPTNSMLGEIRKLDGKFALVGLPCQIHGFVNAANLDKRIKDRIVLTIGLFCHAAIEHTAFEIVWDSLGAKRDEAVRFVSRIGKHPGAPHIELKDGTLHPVYFGDKKGFRPSSMELINVLYRLYTPNRCLLCFDALSEFADISVGDPWMSPPNDDVDFKQGWSMALLRTERGVSAYEELVSHKKLESVDLSEAEAYSCNRHMSAEKRSRAFRVIEKYRRQGKAIPWYGGPETKLPKLSLLSLIKAEINLFTHIFCFAHRFRASVLKFFLGNGGYPLLWLNNKRKRFKVWVRDKVFRIRKTYGRK